MNIILDHLRTFNRDYLNRLDRRETCWNVAIFGLLLAGVVAAAMIVQTLAEMGAG